MNSSWPWSRLRWTQPDSRAGLPGVGKPQLAAGMGAINVHEGPKVRIAAENERTRHGTASLVKAAPDIVAGTGKPSRRP